MAVAPRTTSALAASELKLADHTRHLIAIRLLPFLFILYVTNYLDRTSVAYAAIGMSRTLGFSDRVFGLGAGIFFVSYVALQIPGALMIEHWSARRCITVIMIAWGSLTVLTGLVHTAGELYGARLLLGAAEAGFFPGVVVYLSHWFIREDRAKAGSNFMAAIPLSFIVGSPLAGWILGHPWLGVDGWRWLFVLEGLPAILLGAVAFFYLTDWPRDAAWLAPEQRRWTERTLEEEKPVNAKKITAWQALHSGPILLLASVAFFQYFVFYTLVFWLPTMLKRQSGFSDVRVGLVGTIPYVATLIAMLINGWHSDKTGERRWHSAVPLFIAGLALFGLIVLPHSTQTLVVLFTVLCSTEAFLPVFWAMPTEILSESAAAAGVGLINAVGSIAGFAGPFAFGYLNSRTGSYAYGLTLMMVLAVAGGLLVLQVPRVRASAEISCV
ncbi:MAG TPA: MFS transporter [Terriglobales bacterium]|nr:MFS transporter [Terriglobales bacterium]